MSPDIVGGSHDGAAPDKFTGMRAEFTSCTWFDGKRGKVWVRMEEMDEGEGGG